LKHLLSTIYHWYVGILYTIDICICWSYFRYRIFRFWGPRLKAPFTVYCTQRNGYLLNIETIYWFSISEKKCAKLISKVINCFIISFQIVRKIVDELYYIYTICINYTKYVENIQLIIQFVMPISLCAMMASKTGRTTTTRRSAVRETGFSRHHGGTPWNHSLTSHHYGPEGCKRSS